MRTHAVAIVGASLALMVRAVCVMVAAGVRVAVCVARERVEAQVRHLALLAAALAVAGRAGASILVHSLCTGMENSVTSCGRMDSGTLPREQTRRTHLCNGRGGTPGSRRPGSRCRGGTRVLDPRTHTHRARTPGRRCIWTRTHLCRGCTRGRGTGSDGVCRCTSRRQSCTCR